MHWTCASCGEPKDVQLHHTTKFGPRKHKCSKQPQAQTTKSHAKEKGRRPSVSMLHCNQLATQYGCGKLGLVVHNAVCADATLVSSISVKRWQGWGCTTNFNRTYNTMRSRAFVCSACNASQCKTDKKARRASTFKGGQATGGASGWSCDVRTTEASGRAGRIKGGQATGGTSGWCCGIRTRKASGKASGIQRGQATGGGASKLEDGQATGRASGWYCGVRTR